MASFLDIGLLAGYSKLFVFIFVWLIVYAILKITKVTGTNEGINIVLGLILALLTLFSPLATSIIETIAPWAAVLLVMIMLLSVSTKIFGVKESDVFASGGLKALSATLVIGIFLVLVVSNIRDQVLMPGENGTSTELNTAKAVIFHPQVLGAIFVLLIAIFTIALMVNKSK